MSLKISSVDNVESLPQSEKYYILVVELYFSERLPVKTLPTGISAKIIELIYIDCNLVAYDR